MDNEVWFQVLFSNKNNEFQKPHTRETSIKNLTANAHSCTFNHSNKYNNGVLNYTFAGRTDFTWLVIPSTLQSRTLGIREVTGNRISKFSRLPERAAISIGARPSCQDNKQDKHHLVFDNRKWQTCSMQGIWTSIDIIHIVYPEFYWTNMLIPRFVRWSNMEVQALFKWDG
jgi:hypothetical protein